MICVYIWGLDFPITLKLPLLVRVASWLKYNVIQKVKRHFNFSRGAQMKANREQIEEELKFQPPVQLKLEDTELMNGMSNGGHAGVHVEVVPTYRMEPVTPLGILSLVLNIMCGALNLIRGVHLAEYSFQEDHEGIGNVIAFFLPFLACVFQCYLYLFYSSARKVKTFVLFFSVCFCNLYLYGLRNLWQIAFHIGVASLSSYQILTRQLVEKQPDWGV
ncbi:vesicle-trafficking protein SEC22c isoform X5 [Heliangelus exortis]|uniref:vesicle-trafficking protein SEC22c isoform X5 n=1 Tax=Heliangelus exortis TaxID=472823 RepID=UPI003A924637